MLSVPNSVTVDLLNDALKCGGTAVYKDEEIFSRLTKKKKKEKYLLETFSLSTLLYFFIKGIFYQR